MILSLSPILGATEIPTWIGELAFGSVVLLALFGWIWFKPGVSDLQARLLKTEAQRDALIEVYQDEIMPALRDATLGVSRTVDVVEEAVPLLREVKVLLLRERE